MLGLLVNLGGEVQAVAKVIQIQFVKVLCWETKIYFGVDSGLASYLEPPGSREQTISQFQNLLAVSTEPIYITSVCLS